MQFSFKPSQCFQCDTDGFVILQGSTFTQKLKSLKPDILKNISEIITAMGVASAKAQNLKQTITTFERFVGSDNRIYMKLTDNKVFGLLKVGEKNLFYRDYIGNIKEIKPTCVLDFYVHESCQRSGIGKQIFQRFLSQEKKIASKLAYDRPSQKLIGFLKKHYGLAKYIPQNNNYVIFNQYFQSTTTKQNNIVLKQFNQKQKPQINKAQLNKTMQNIGSKKQTDIQQIKKHFNMLEISNSSSKKGPYILSYPWAEKNEKTIFRTTSNTYGSHYK